MATVTRKLFLEVDDPVVVADAVERSLFVPTRLPFHLGEPLVLGLRVSGRPGAGSAALELPVVVIGRRPPRSGALLSAGVLVRLADAGDPDIAAHVDALRALARGDAVDAAALQQHRLRLPTRVRFADRDEACAELAGLLDDEGALLDVDAPFVRGDRLVLRVDIGAAAVGPVAAVNDDGGVTGDVGNVVKDVVAAPSLTVAVLVKRSLKNAGKPAVVAVAIDDAARAVIVTYLQGGSARGRAIESRVSQPV